MACGYWDYDSTGSTTGDLGTSWDFGADATSTVTTITTTVVGASQTYTTGSGERTYDRPTIWTTTATRVRRILVKIPKKWNKEKIAAYVKLINRETNTGWKVDMVIEGDVAIVDPDIEIREMDEFIPLLKESATTWDRRKIDAFFEAGE